MLHTHTLTVVLFLLIYLIKCVLIWISPTTLTKFHHQNPYPRNDCLQPISDHRALSGL